MSSATVPTPEAEAWPDAAFIERAIEQANLNALRLALYQQTGDPALAAMRLEPRGVRGGAMTVNAVAHADRPAIKAAALEYLRHGPVAPSAPPSPSEAARLLEIFGTPPSDRWAAQQAYEELAFADAPRDPNWAARPSADVLARYKVTIIGAGISGLAMAIKLARLGIPFEIIERQSGVGGTWLLNDYPEARVDITNFLYEFKFEKAYPWRSYFASQAEIRAYLEYIAVKYGVMEHIRFNTEVHSATWDETQHLWHLRLASPGAADEAVNTRILVSASGLFSTPNLPDIAGIGEFTGPMFHTTAWDHAVPLAGKRIALIGTGSSGGQLMPHLAREAASLAVFQRTANWIVPIDGYHAPVTEEQRWLMRHLPYYWNWFCYAMTVLDRQIEPLQIHDPEWRAANCGFNERNDQLRDFLLGHLTRSLSDRPDLLAKSRPGYPPAARRMVVDNGWFEALKRPNVELVTAPIQQITAGGVTTTDGTARAFDIIVLGSGFRTSQYLWPVRYHGRGGVTPDDLWAADGARSYLGMTMPGFPNFFMFYGPNGQPRAGSFHGWAELWSRYVIRMVMAMIARDATAAEVRPEVYRDYNARLDAAMSRLIWGDSGAGSYYLNEHGRSGVNMPWTVAEYYRWVAEPDLTDFSFS